MPEEPWSHSSRARSQDMLVGVHQLIGIVKRKTVCLHACLEAGQMTCTTGMTFPSSPHLESCIHCMLLRRVCFSMLVERAPRVMTLGVQPNITCPLLRGRGFCFRAEYCRRVEDRTCYRSADDLICYKVAVSTAIDKELSSQFNSPLNPSGRR